MISPASHLTYPPTIERRGYHMASFAALGAAVALSAAVADGAAAQGVDPRCRDRAAQGRFTCVIEQPPVQRRETLVPDVVFAPGDTVLISAAGCVNVSRDEVKWRRYVDPRGPDSESLYHGLIRIPTATRGSGLVRIQDVVNRPLIVRGGGLPSSEFVLYLGYEDGPLDYQDNHYGGPRDHRAGSQCRSQGLARVSLTVVRGGQAPPPLSNRFHFNLEWTAVGPGGFPLNPRWTWQRLYPDSAPPSAAICHYFSRTLENVDIQVPYIADCTDQTDLDHVDTPGSWPVFCGFGGPGFNGHLNWFTVTYEGTAAGRKKDIWDGDYSIQLVPPGGSGLMNGGRELHTEFDSDETVDQFGSRWWRTFGQSFVFNVPGAAETLFQGTPIIMTGLFGLDCEHNCNTELHPVYAVAAHVRENPSHDVWAMFVRNAGNEGYCSSHIWEAPFQTYTFRLPWRAGMDSVRVLRGPDESEFTGTEGTSGPTVRYTRERGVDVTFQLPTPANRPHIDGALHLRWFGTAAARRVVAPAVAPVVSARQPEAEGDTEKRLAAAFARLSPAQRRQVELARPPATKRAVHRLADTGPAVAQPLALAVARAVRLGARGPLATRKLARDSAQIRALCAASGDSIAGLPRRVCTLPPRR